MNRLSENATDIVNDLNRKGIIDYRSEYLPIIKALNKLAEHEGFEQLGQLVKLSCKVGDTVYILAGSSRRHMLPNKVEQEKCEGFYIGDDNIAQIRVSHRKENHATYGVMNETVFLTREEAEQALKEAHNDEL